MSSEKLVKPGSSVYRRETKKGPRYRLRVQLNGQSIKRNIEEVSSDAQAVKKGKEILGKLLIQTSVVKKSNHTITCEEIIKQILSEKKKTKRASTYQNAKIIYETHIIPFLSTHCPLASHLNNSVWMKYKAMKADKALFNHHKYFQTLCRRVHELGLLEKPIRLSWSPKLEINSEPGRVIPDHVIRLMIQNASDDWKDRIIISRYTGMRPGEVRCLLKDRVDFKTRIVHLAKEDTKTGQARSFSVPMQVYKVLDRRRLGSFSPYFFPNKLSAQKPADKTLKAWNRMLKRVDEALKNDDSLRVIERGVENTKGLKMIPNYTPHDLRHTYLTHQFKNPNISHALVCYAAGLSLEMAQKTYLHFTAEDTRIVSNQMEGFSI